MSHSDFASILPEKFYKYRSMESSENAARTEKVVLHDEIFFASPRTFNDPFDLKLSFSLTASPQQQREDFLRLSRKYQPNLSETEHQVEANRVVSMPLNADNIATTTTLIQFLHAEALTNVGVFCVSTKRDDILMWSHYADSHRGICLEFDGLSPLMAQAQRVNYSSKRVPINPYTDNPETMMKKGLLTKSDHWVYENEWRLIRYADGPGVAKYSPTNLTGIILGALASPKTVATVHDWVSRRSFPLPIYRATTSAEEFELLISPAIKA